MRHLFSLFYYSIYVYNNERFFLDLKILLRIEFEKFLIDNEVKKGINFSVYLYYEFGEVDKRRLICNVTVVFFLDYLIGIYTGVF